jgi:hypothetical protein
MRQFIFGFIAALALLAAGGFAFVELGLAPVATSSAPLPFEKQIATAALDARVNKEAPKLSPIAPSDQVYAAAHRFIGTIALFVMVCPGRTGRRLQSASSPRRRNFSRVKALLTFQWASLIGKSPTASG